MLYVYTISNILAFIAVALIVGTFVYSVKCIGTNEQMEYASIALFWGIGLLIASAVLRMLVSAICVNDRLLIPAYHKCT